MEFGEFCLVKFEIEIVVSIGIREKLRNLVEFCVILSEISKYLS